MTSCTPERDADLEEISTPIDWFLMEPQPEPDSDPPRRPRRERRYVRPTGPDPFARLIRLYELIPGNSRYSRWAKGRPGRPGSELLGGCCPVCGKPDVRSACVICRLKRADEVLGLLDPGTRFRVARVLRVVSSSPPTLATRLASDLGMHSQALAELLRNLELAGLVTVENKNKGCVAEVTPRGERWLREYESEPPRCR